MNNENLAIQNKCKLKHEDFVIKEQKAKNELMKKCSFAFIDKAPFCAADVYPYFSGFNMKTKTRTVKYCMILNDSSALDDEVVICPIATKSNLQNRRSVNVGKITTISTTEECYALFMNIRKVNKLRFRLRSDLLLCENEPIGRVDDEFYIEIVQQYKNYVDDLLASTYVFDKDIVRSSQTKIMVS